MLWKHELRMFEHSRRQHWVQRKRKNAVISISLSAIAKALKTLLNNSFSMIPLLPLNHLAYKIPTPKKSSKKGLLFSPHEEISRSSVSSIWLLNGTLKTAPNIFAQIFTIIGLWEHTGQVVAVPLVYVFLSGKKPELYKEVLEVIKDAFQRAPCAPTRRMSDFELAIMNACTEVFPGVPLSGCYLQLGQIIHRMVQSDGLQEQYREPLDRPVKRYTHMLLYFLLFPRLMYSNFFPWATLRMSGWTAWSIRWLQGMFYYWKASKRSSPATRPRNPIWL